MATLEDWKSALASGVKIETLLGLNKGGSQQRIESSKDKDTEKGDISASVPDTQPLNLSVTTASGWQLEFQWSSPSLSTIWPVGHDTPAETRNPSIPSDLAVAPPVIPVKQIVGPCFIDVAHNDHLPVNETRQPPD